MNIDTSHFKKLLQDEKRVLENDLNSLGHASGKQDGLWDTEQKESVDTADREDVASSIEEYEQSESTVADIETQLHEVNSALDKIEAGTYGTCEVCNQEIETDRLEANPSARTCKTHLNS